MLLLDCNFAKFLLNQRALSHIDRYDKTPKIGTNSVAEHSFYITLYGMFIGDMISATEGIQINKELLIRKLLLHDNEERITGDIIFTTHTENKALGEELERVRCRIADEELFKDIVFDRQTQELADYYIMLFKTAKDNSIEGLIVDFTDKFEILMYALEQRKLGNRHFDEIIIRCFNILSSDKFQISKFLSQLIKYSMTLHREICR